MVLAVPYVLSWLNADAMSLWSMLTSKEPKYVANDCLYWVSKPFPMRWGRRCTLSQRNQTNSNTFLSFLVWCSELWRSAYITWKNSHWYGKRGYCGKQCWSLDKHITAGRTFRRRVARAKSQFGVTILGKILQRRKSTMIASWFRSVSLATHSIVDNTCIYARNGGQWTWSHCVDCIAAVIRICRSRYLLCGNEIRHSRSDGRTRRAHKMWSIEFEGDDRFSASH